MPRNKSQTIQRRVPSQARASATVEAILEAAARIIRRQGSDALTTNRIAEVAGVSVGTLYGYYPDKTAILLDMARRMLRHGEAATAAALDEDRGVDPARVLVRATLKLHDTDKDVRRAVMGAHLGRGHGDEHGASTQASVQRIVERLTAVGAPPPDPVALFVVTRAVLGVARALVEEPDGSAPPPGALEDELMSLIGPYLAERFALPAA